MFISLQFIAPCVPIQRM